ncbi:MAG: TauD/TfdA dioxygenase family protein [Gammaproteobacteria bacterium]
MINNHPEVVPVSPVLGAEIRNVDLALELSDEVISIIKSTFNEYSVIIFPNQKITIEQQKKFASHFGELMIQKHLLPVTMKDHPECIILRNDQKNPPGLNYWHTDNSGWECPPLGTMLYSIKTPILGGDTIFSSMYKAYEKLSPAMKEFLRPLMAIHDVKKAFGDEYKNLQQGLKKYGIDSASHFAEFNPVKHPLVRTHPVTNKLALYFSEPYTLYIEGLSKNESKTILDFLYRHVQTEEFIYRHKWKQNDLVLWDNRCLQHYAVADYYPEERIMHRLNICGERPF